MLNQFRSFETNKPCNVPMVDDKWARNIKEDMKTALDLVFKFCEDLDKLHPECKTIVDKMFQNFR